MMRRIALCAVLALACCPPARAGEWQHYTFASSVHTIAEEDNYLWLATDNGLVRFDKSTYEKKIFTRTNSELPSSRVTCVVVDHDGVKWMATEDKLVRFDDVTWQTYSRVDKVSALSGVGTLYVDHNNTLWAASWRTLYSYSNGNWRSHPSPGFFVQTITETEDGMLMLGGEGPTRLYNPATGLLLQADAESAFVSGARFTAISLDSAGQVWASDATEQGVIRFSTDTATRFDYTNSPIEKYSRVNDIVTDRDGMIWIATSRNGLVRYDGTTWRTFVAADLSSPDPSSPPVVMALTTDDRQNLYIGYQNGYGVFDGTDMRWDAHTGTDFGVQSLSVDQQGTTWLVARTSADFIPGAPLSLLDIGEQNAHCVLTDRNGTIWIGTDNGVVAYDHLVQREFTPFNSKMLHHCTAIAEAPDGALWFGVTSGIVRYDGTTWTRYVAHSIPALAGVTPAAMAFDSTGTLWIGNSRSAGQPLVRFDGREWSAFSTLDGSRLYTVPALVTDRNGTLWLATCSRSSDARERGQGALARLDGTEWTVYPYAAANSPLPSSFVTSLAVDANNDLWIGTHNGLLRHRSDKVTVSVAEPSRETLAPSFLGQNRPNPASVLTTIPYEIPGNAVQQVQLTVFNTLGAPVATLVERPQQPGSYTVDFNTSALPAGMYYYRLTIGSATISKQMVIAR